VSHARCRRAPTPMAPQRTVSSFGAANPPMYRGGRDGRVREAPPMILMSAALAEGNGGTGRRKTGAGQAQGFSESHGDLRGLFMIKRVF